MARSLTPSAPADGRASAAPAVPGSLVPPLGLGDTRAHYRAGRGVIETPAAQATVHAQGGHARGA